ncbi:MAG: hypothetical protein EA349_09700 [Halomonadaceae bacterium]|nr:MAG: hypothetical protein EA349_09700 [Halomonadaceae bacterium]
MAENAAPEGKKKSNIKTLLILGLVLVLAVGLSVAATLFFLVDREGVESSQSDDIAVTESAPETISYYRFNDAFVVTLADERQRYLQVHLAVVIRDQDISDQLERHSPTLRSRIQSVLARQRFSELRDEAARETLRGALRDSINQVMEEEGSEGIEQVLYTNFVMQ